MTVGSTTRAEAPRESANNQSETRPERYRHIRSLCRLTNATHANESSQVKHPCTQSISLPAPMFSDEVLMSTQRQWISDCTTSTTGSTGSTSSSTGSSTRSVIAPPAQLAALAAALFCDCTTSTTGTIIQSGPFKEVAVFWESVPFVPGSNSVSPRCLGTSAVSTQTLRQRLYVFEANTSVSKASEICCGHKTNLQKTN